MDKELWWWCHHHQQHHHHHHDHIRCSRSLRTGSIMLRASAGVPALTCSPYGWKSITFENDEWINIIILRHVCKYVFTTAQSFQGGDVYGRVANANVLLFIWGESFQQIFSSPHQNLLHNRQSKNSDVKRCQNKKKRNIIKKRCPPTSPWGSAHSQSSERSAFTGFW